MPNRLTETLDAYPIHLTSAISVHVELMLRNAVSTELSDGKWISLFNFSISDREGNGWNNAFTLFACLCAEVDDETLDAIIKAIETGEL